MVKRSKRVCETCARVRARIRKVLVRTARVKGKEKQP